MKVVKFKVLLYLKKSGLDKSGKAPIMGRITVNRENGNAAEACQQQAAQVVVGGVPRHLPESPETCQPQARVRQRDGA